MGLEFLGTGWKFPVKLDEGEIALSHQEQDVEESIRIILGTAPGERVMRPEFGCGIHDLVFALNSTHTAGLIQFHVEQALMRWEPRIDQVQVHVETDPAEPEVLMIHVSYKVRATDSRYNLVYPFYLERSQSL